jgi:hypothetical protein
MTEHLLHKYIRVLSQDDILRGHIAIAYRERHLYDIQASIICAIHISQDKMRSITLNI